MQFLTSLFGGSGNMWLTALFALGVVIVLIFIVMWLLRLLAGGNGTVGRGRNRRLAVVDSLVVDQKRQLLIVRRDDVEHLILTGGPADVVVETGIPVAEPPARPVPQRRPMFGRPAEPQAPVPAAPQTPTVPAVSVQPAVANVSSPPVEAPSSNVSPLDRMRTATGGRRNGKLRHPGLTDDPARPQEETGDGALPARDSAKESGDGNGGKLSDDEAQAKAEGRAGDGG